MALENKLSGTRAAVSPTPKARRTAAPRDSRTSATGKTPMPAPATTSGTERSSRKPAQTHAAEEQMMMFKRDQ
jgi:hypothetical protein